MRALGGSERSCFVAGMRAFVLPAVAGFGLAIGCTSETPTDKPSAATANPGSQPAAAPASAPASAPHGALEGGSPGEPVAGVIKLGDDVSTSDVKPTDVLFIMARESQGGSRAGRLVAVQRHGQLTFPKRFELSSKDAMVPGVPFKGPFVVYARLDKDGDPMTRGPDDLYGAVPDPVNSGVDTANIVLKKRGPAPASQPSK